MIYIFMPVCSAGPFPQLEDKPLNFKLLLVWEHLKDLLSQSPFFYQQQRDSRCLLREILCDI